MEPNYFLICRPSEGTVIVIYEAYYRFELEPYASAGLEVVSKDELAKLTKH